MTRRDIRDNESDDRFAHVPCAFRPAKQRFRIGPLPFLDLSFAIFR